MDKERLKVFSNAECSEEFMRAFHGDSSIALDCGACGREHFEDAHDAGDWDDGEFEELQRKHEADPDRCVAHDDRVLEAHFLGTQFVIDCPCGFAAHAEQLLWAYAHPVMQYIAAHAKANKSEADETAEMADTAMAALES